MDGPVRLGGEDEELMRMICRHGTHPSIPETPLPSNISSRPPASPSRQPFRSPPSFVPPIEVELNLDFLSFFSFFGVSAALPARIFPY